MLRTLAALGLLLVLPSSGLAAEPSPLSKENVGRKATEAKDTAKQYSAQERAQVERTIQAELDELDAGIQRLRSRIDHLSDDTRKRAESSLADLERRKEEARRKLSEIKVAGEAVWDRLRTGLESSLADLHRLYERMVPSK